MAAIVVIWQNEKNPLHRQAKCFTKQRYHLPLCVRIPSNRAYTCTQQQHLQGKQCFVLIT